VDHFEDQFADTHEPLGIPFDEEANFFHPEEVQDEEFPAAQQAEESIYTDDPVRVYLREMGAVPLLTREGEVNLARRMERGKIRMQKSISRSALVQRLVGEIAERVKRNEEELDNLVDLGDIEEGTPADLKRQAEVRQQFIDITVLARKQQQTAEKVEAVPPGNKKLRRKWQGKLPAASWSSHSPFGRSPGIRRSGRRSQRKSSTWPKKSPISKLRCGGWTTARYRPSRSRRFCRTARPRVPRHGSANCAARFASVSWLQARRKAT